MLIRYNEKRPNVDDTAFVADNASIIGECTISKDASVWYGAVLRADIAPIIVGEGSNIQDGTVCHVDFGKPVIIGKNVTIGHNVTLHACTIEDGVLVGMGAVVLDGAVVEAGALVGAGSVVSPNTVVSAGTLYLGNPAREKRKLRLEEMQSILKNAELYVKLAKEHKKV